GDRSAAAVHGGGRPGAAGAPSGGRGAGGRPSHPAGWLPRSGGSVRRGPRAEPELRLRGERRHPRRDALRSRRAAGSGRHGVGGRGGFGGAGGWPGGFGVDSAVSNTGIEPPAEPSGAPILRGGIGGGWAAGGWVGVRPPLRQEVGLNPRCMALTPDGGHLWVA